MPRTETVRLATGPMALLLHLRLPFQLALSVVFLWGVFVSGGGFETKTFLGWVAFTVGLSGGATAFNSYYDRDRGPVSGLRRPPPVSPALLPFAVAVEASGLLLAAIADVRLGALYLASALLLDGYSHPAVRLKRHPWLSMASVAIGSGALVALAGSVAASGEVVSSRRADALAGALASALAIAGYYPLTQLGQEAEDRRRSDRTFVLAYGREAAFRWAFGIVGLAGLVAVVQTIRLAGSGAGAGLALAYGAVGFEALRWKRDPLRDGSRTGDALAYALAAVHLAVVLYGALAAGSDVAGFSP